MIMMTRGVQISSAKIWSLFNLVDKNQYDGLSSEEARAIVMILSPEVRNQWFAFKAGWSEWKELKNCPSLLSMASVHQSTSVGYPVPEFSLKKAPQLQGVDLAQSDDENEPVEITESYSLAEPTSLFSQKGKKNNSLSEEELAAQNRRKFKRVELDLSVEILCQERSFETHTTDVSLGGIAVDGCLPDWIAGYCTVILWKTGFDEEKIEFMCSVVENQKGKNYRLELYPSIYTKNLEEWIEEAQSSQECELEKAE